jgi:hypothetical protein
MHVLTSHRFPGLPDDEEARLDSGFLILTAAEIKDIFEPVVKEVCDLVQGQVDGLRNKGGIVSGIVLVGGFGQSEYLYKRLRGHFTTGAPPPYSERPTHATARAVGENGSIEVMQPLYAWTAVVRGAVLRGLEGNMVIRMHYGTSYATVYDEEKHSVSERYWSPLWERWMVSDRMQWHIAKVSFSFLFRFQSPSFRYEPPEKPHKDLFSPIINLCSLPHRDTGRSHLPSVSYRVPLHAQLPAGAIAHGDGRPDRVRCGRAACRL